MCVCVCQDEEARIAYVALSRAKNSMTISHVQEDYRGLPRVLSRFLGNIDTLVAGGAVARVRGMCCVVGRETACRSLMPDSVPSPPIPRLHTG